MMMDKQKCLFLKMDEVVVPEILTHKGDFDGRVKQAKLFVNRHPYLPFVQLCYDNNRSESSLLSDQCRGLIVDEQTWDVVAWGFDRFKKASNFSKKFVVSTVQVKEDGSLLFLFNYKGSWMLSTRHTFCDQPSERVYVEAFASAIGYDYRIVRVEFDTFLSQFANSLQLSPDFTYSLELCSPQTRIVRPYDQPTIFLLAAHNKHNHQELSQDALDAIVTSAKLPSFKRPITVGRDLSIKKAIWLLREWEKNHELFEGFVLLMNDGRRLKLKSQTYKLAHDLRYRGWIKATPITLIGFVLRDQTNVLDMLRQTRHDFDEFQTRWYFLKHIVDVVVNETSCLWRSWINKNVSSSIQKLEDFHVWLSEQDCKQTTKELCLKKWSLFREARPIEGDEEEEPVWKDIFANYENTFVESFFDDKASSHWALSQTVVKEYCCVDPDKLSDIFFDKKSGVTSLAPFKIENGWFVTCYCGKYMDCKRLKYDHIYYDKCPCGDVIGTYLYPSGSLLYVCEECGCTHECYQTDNIYDGKQVMKGQPLGLPASKNLKTVRLYLHHLLDKKFATKKDMYDWISQTLSLPPDVCHIAQLNLFQCEQIIRHLLQFLSAKELRLIVYKKWIDGQ